MASNKEENNDEEFEKEETDKENTTEEDSKIETIVLKKLQVMQEEIDKMEKRQKQLDEVKNLIVLEESEMEANKNNIETDTSEIMKLPIFTKKLEELSEKVRLEYERQLRIKTNERIFSKKNKKVVSNSPKSWHSTPNIKGSRLRPGLSESTIYDDQDDEDEQNFAESMLLTNRLVSPSNIIAAHNGNGDDREDDLFEPKRMKGVMTEAYLIRSYRGSEDSLENFESDLNNTAEICSWRNNQKTYVAKNKLAGEALKFKSTSRDLRDSQDFDEVLKLLRDRFEPKVSVHTLINQIQTCRQKPDENIAEFAARLKAIGYKLADIPDSRGAEEAAAQHTLSAFLNNLYDFHIRLAVLKREPTDIREAVDYAMKEEQFANNAKQSRKNYNSSLVPTEDEPQNETEENLSTETRFQDMVNIAIQTIKKETKTNDEKWNKRAEEFKQNAELNKQKNDQFRQDFEKKFELKEDNYQKSARFNQNNYGNKMNNDPRDVNIECYLCGKRGHRRRDCNYCTYCKKGPHKAEECRLRIRNEREGIYGGNNETRAGVGRYPIVPYGQNAWSHAQPIGPPGIPPTGWHNPPSWQNSSGWQGPPRWPNPPNNPPYSVGNDGQSHSTYPSPSNKLPIEYNASPQTKNHS